jgi:hypothetical protein
MRLGEFISEKVYDRKLQSRHEIVDHSCLAFINVAKGEEMNRGNSYQVSVTAKYRTTGKLMLLKTEHGGGAYGRQGRQTI